MELIIGSLLLLTIIVAGLAVVVKQTRRLSAAEERERHAGRSMARWTSLLSEPLDTEQPRRDLANRIVEMCLSEFEVSGALFLGEAPEGRSQRELPVWGAAGLCRGWGDRPAEMASRELSVLTFDHELPHHFFWSSEPLIYEGERIRHWLPAQTAGACEALLVAPVQLAPQQRGLLMVLRETDEARFSRLDQANLGAVVRLAETRLRLLALQQQIDELTDQVQQAHETGMRQIASGIIHNIGNAVTVVQLGLEELNNDLISSAREVSSVVSQELVGELQGHVADGSLEEWLAPVEGQPGMADIFAQAVGQIDQQLGEIAAKALQISLKFDDITAVIDLQQRFLGELGTEGIVSVGNVLRDVQQACAATLETRGIDLEMNIESESRLLVDPAMLQHVLMRLMKQAVDSISSSQRAVSTIRLTSYNENRDGKDWVVIEVLDTGFDAPFDLDSMERNKLRAGMEDRVDDYLFCREQVEKYNGSFAVSGRLDKGTTVRLQLPRYRD